MTKIVEEIAYAKINLTLDIKGKREDGYHELESIMVPITLHDKLTFEVNDSNIIDIQMSTGNIKTENNIIYKTIMLMKDQYPIDKGIKIYVEKNIPVEAGLAGGSSDCAATIRAINNLFNLKIPFDKMLEIANKLGSDTAFCLLGKPAIVTGRGDRLIEIDCNFEHEFYILKPNFGMSTAEIFKSHKLSSSTSTIERVKKSLNTNDKDLLLNNWFNDLEKTVLDISNDMKLIRENLKSITDETLMSGSGSSIIAFCTNEKKLIDFAEKYHCKLYKTKIENC